jgi:hypothetical protein
MHTYNKQAEISTQLQISLLVQNQNEHTTVDIQLDMVSQMMQYTTVELVLT